MKFKPTKRKILISITIPLLIIIILLTLISLSGPNCHYGGGGEISVDYWSECSIFEFAYTIFGSIIIFWTILFLLIYVFYSLFQRKTKVKPS